MPDPPAVNSIRNDQRKLLQKIYRYGKFIALLEQSNNRRVGSYMKITEFGKVVRKARLDAEVSLLDMAEALDVSSAFLSGMETGRKKIATEWVAKIGSFFNSRGIRLQNLAEAADVSNKSVSLEGLPPAHQMLVAGFARASLTQEEMNNLQTLLAAANTKQKGSNS